MWAKPCLLARLCHCFIIRQHMLEKGGRAHQLPIKHHDRKSLECLELMSCLPIICVCMCVCACVCVFQHSVCLIYLQACMFVRALVIAAPLSVIHSLREPFANDSKGRREHGVAEGRDGEKSRTIERMGEVRVTDVCSRFLLVCLWLFSSWTIQKHKCGTAL